MNTNMAIAHSAKLEKKIEGPNVAEDSLRELVETVPIGIVIADEVGRIAELNSETLKLFGYSRPELLGQPVEKLLPERLQNPNKEHRFRYTKEPYATPMGLGLELVACRKDGT